MTGAALVAGGAGALGSAVVAELRARGWDVTVLDRHEHGDEAAVGGDGEALGRLAYVQADLLDQESAAAAVESVDGLKAVVNLVGGFSMGPKVGETDLDDFEFMLRLNLFPAFNLARAAMPRLVAAGGGAFVCVSARAALEPFSRAAGYITAKAAILAFIRSLDVEYRCDGVRANAVLPSVIDTPANRESMSSSDWSKWVPPEQIARVIAALCSDDLTPTSGAAVPVYGRA
ncbi:MAG TPA: SDR family NAD(P)-dependent oxidoreductase [Thermoleophilaceae bacterium]|nr:SDR family NAD(P)-dependent oxidoreductase [Thermoleophilaceae bacterium]